MRISLFHFFSLPFSSFLLKTYGTHGRHGNVSISTPIRQQHHDTRMSACCDDGPCVANKETIVIFFVTLCVCEYCFVVFFQCSTFASQTIAHCTARFAHCATFFSFLFFFTWLLIFYLFSLRAVDTMSDCWQLTHPPATPSYILSHLSPMKRSLS